MTHHDATSPGAAGHGLAWLAGALAAIALAAGLYGVLHHRTVAADRRAKAELVALNLTEVQDRIEKFEAALNEKKRLLTRITEEINKLVKKKESQEITMAQVMARFKALEEQRALFDAAKADMQRRLLDLYELRRLTGPK